VSNGRLYVAIGRLHVSHGRLYAAIGRLYVSHGRLYAVIGRLYVSNGRLYAVIGRLYESYGVPRSAKRRSQGKNLHYEGSKRCPVRVVRSMRAGDYQ
jgi:hypothetical protein